MKRKRSKKQRRVVERVAGVLLRDAAYFKKQMYDALITTLQNGHSSPKIDGKYREATSNLSEEDKREVIKQFMKDTDK